ncbi:hypothetical protein WJX73_008272 [Symbiochloris irregularis]|uniref:Paladin n=1 Tax=Symbiochloris irregularis TaxID=706552 RepID=A0AAW1P7I1_9CHLO
MTEGPPENGTAAQSRNAEQQYHHNVVANRTGEVLIKHTLLKSDHFPGCQNKTLTPLLEGAPNFRQVPGLPVYGVAIPTVSGLQLVLDGVGNGGKRKVLWHNMREEPVLYINGKPYVVRESNKPFANLEYTGIDRSRVEAMERRLKQDVLKEAELYGNQVLVADESDDFQVVERWEPVTEVDVQTPLEVYHELKDDGYDIDYLRVPVTDEKAPKEADIALLLQRLWNAPEGGALVFNCQMGRGRTTTGMIIAALVCLKRASPSLTLPEKPIEGMPAWWVEAADPLISPRSDEHRLETEIKAGRFGVIRSLLRVLEQGAAAKAVLDAVIDANAAMQNLREAIAGYRSRMIHETNEDKRTALLHVCLEYLERYYVLIAFVAFIMGPDFDPKLPRQRNFGQWMSARPELRSVLQRMLRRNPLAALAMNHTSLPRSSLEGEGQKHQPSDQEAAEDASALLVATRSGAVLGPHTILKEDHFPGCQSSKLPPRIPGAPNFRGVERVYGSALPTVEGIRQVLDHVGCSPSSSENGSSPKEATALWYNMREEVVVYINGQPFVLREDERPFKNMQEYRGIDAGRLELMETRLAADVRREMARDGQVLVAREQVSATGQAASTITDAYEPVSSASAVMTPREVYDSLRREGYRVDYNRVPLTDGAAPREAIFDTFYEGIRTAGDTNPIIFNCQMGAGRTTTGMVVACLIRFFFSEKHGEAYRQEPRSELAVNTALPSPVGEGPVQRAASQEADDDVAGLSPAGSAGLDDDDEALALKAAADKQPSPQRLLTHHSRQMNELVEVAMKEGEYVGVRRFIRALERGLDCKDLVDQVVDRCEAVINLRTAIMRYRKPRDSFRFYRPEINVRHSAFTRGAAYLERYCLLISFAAFLWRAVDGLGVERCFSEWMEARPDVVAASTGIHQNPAGALAPVPTAAMPRMCNGDRANSQTVALQEQRNVLSKRHGSTLSRRSILKAHNAPQQAPKRGLLSFDGITDVRQASDMPVFSVGMCSVQGLRNLLRHFGARPGGPAHFVVSDLREELVAYVNGWPYVRRELDQHAAALHHAGIRAVKLEELERRLRNDLTQEAMIWGSRILLHRELAPPTANLGVTRSGTPTLRESLTGAPSSHSPSRSPSMQQLQLPLSKRLRFTELEGAESLLPQMSDDVTRKEESSEPEQLIAFWEGTGDLGDVDMGLATPLEVFQSLAAEGFQINYRRIPLSRERTPEAADLDVLHSQMVVQPEGKQVVHLVLSRSATGSSVRFVSAFVCASLALQPPPVMPLTPSGSTDRLAHLIGSAAAARKRRQNNSHGDSSACPAHAARPVTARTAAMLGEYRNIMNLLRVLPGGTEAKLAVDDAIDACYPIGNFREDIFRCKEAADAPVPNSASPFARSSVQSTAASARRLGLHYLQRYFFLITFVCYLCARSPAPPQHGAPAPPSFARWVSDRHELRHLLSTLTLETTT